MQKLQTAREGFRAACARVYVTGVALAAPVLAFATPSAEEAAFDAVEAKVTEIGGYALALAIVATLVWIGIDLFKKGAKKGAK